MNKRFFHFSSILSILSLVSVYLILPSGVLQAQDTGSDLFSPTAKLWAAGAEHGAYLVLGKSLPKGEGFQIFFRESLKETLLTGKTYPGKPLCVTTDQKRLLVFLDNGGCQSYSIDTISRTEQRLPRGLLAVAAVTSQGQVYILARAQQSIEIELISSTQAADIPGNEPALVQNDNAKKPETEESAAPTGADEKKPLKTPSTSAPLKLTVQKGDTIVLVRGKDNQWRSVGKEILPVTDWIQPALAVQGDVVHVFGIKSESTDETSPTRSLLHCQLEKGEASTPQVLPIDNVTSVTALEVNRQLRVIAGAAADETVLPDQKAWIRIPSVYRVGWPTEQDWKFTEPPLQRKPKETLSARPDTLVFAALEQNLAAFERRSEEELLFGIYDSGGKIVQDFTQNLVTVKEIPPWLQALTWLFSPQVGLLLMILTFLIVFRRRRDFLSELPNLPQYVQTASLGRRSAAAIIDLIPAWVVAYSLVPVEVDPNTSFQDNFWQESQLLAQNPDLFKFLGVLYLSWIGYLVFSEILLSATPGKLIFQLIVLTETLTPLTPKEALIRNLLRIFEFHITMVFLGFFLALISRRRQRLGDLMARSIVVIKTPELQNQLIKYLQKNYFQRWQAKDSDSQENPEDKSQDDKDE
jgi:uncharacterized RDD family membrane protein YckC